MTPAIYFHTGEATPSPARISNHAVDEFVRHYRREFELSSDCAIGAGWREAWDHLNLAMHDRHRYVESTNPDKRTFTREPQRCYKLGMTKSLDEIARICFEASAGARPVPSTADGLMWTAQIATAVHNLQRAIGGPQITAQPYGHVERSRYETQGPAMEAQIDADRDNKHRLTIALADERKRHEVTQAQLDKFQSACADQTIQIMELRGLVSRAQESAMRALELEARCTRLEKSLEHQLSAMSPSEAMTRDLRVYIDAIGKLMAHIPNPTTADPAGVVDAAIEHINAPCEDCKVLAAQLDAMPAGVPLPPVSDVNDSDSDIKF